MRHICADNAMGETWWQNATRDVCVLEFGVGTDRFEAASACEAVETGGEGVDTVCLRYYPDVDASVCPRLPEVVRLIVPTADGTSTYQLRVVSSEGTMVRVASVPLTIKQRRVRRTPRVPYHLGPYAAVVHGANGQWRGVIEFQIWDVSASGVGFKAELGRAFLLAVGDNIRAPITLPNGRRNRLEGNVAWLAPDGRGGMALHKPLQWAPTVAFQEQTA